MCSIGTGLCVSDALYASKPELLSAIQKLRFDRNRSSQLAYADRNGNIVPKYSPQAQVVLSPGEDYISETFTPAPSLNTLTIGQKHGKITRVRFIHPSKWAARLNSA